MPCRFGSFAAIGNLFFLVFLVGCGANGNGSPETQGGRSTLPDTSAQGVGKSLASAVCACYAKMSDAVRRTQIPAYQELTLEERIRYGKGVDSLSQDARLCFSNAKQQHGISDKRKRWSETQKNELETALGSQIQQLCPRVAEFLAGGDFY